jgi:mannose-6-phosphate isomerase-like protein (cupin superfamily)
MHTPFFMYPQNYSYHRYVPLYNYGWQPSYWSFPYETYFLYAYNDRTENEDGNIMFADQGPEPYVVNINEATKQNTTYRTAIWTGDHLQVTLMSLNVGEDIGLEMHPDVDQFLRIEQGEGIVQMGDSKDNLTFERMVSDDSAIVVPAGTWHNVTNTGNIPLRLYSIYAPPNHPFGTVHVTKEEAMVEE